MALVERPQSGWSLASSYAPRAIAVDEMIGIGTNVMRVLKKWRARREQRREIARLTDRMLADIGLSRLDATREANKPFWLE